MKPTIQDALTNKFILLVLGPIYVITIIGLIVIFFYTKQAIDDKIDFQVDKAEYTIVNQINERLDVMVDGIKAYESREITLDDLIVFLKINSGATEQIKEVFLLDEDGHRIYPLEKAHDHHFEHHEGITLSDIPANIYTWFGPTQDDEYDHYDIVYKLDEGLIFFIQFDKVFMDWKLSDIKKAFDSSDPADFGIMKNDLTYIGRTSDFPYDYYEEDTELDALSLESENLNIKRANESYYLVDIKHVEGHNINIVSYASLYDYYNPILGLVLFTIFILVVCTIVFIRFRRRYVNQILGSINDLTLNVERMTKNNQQWLLDPQPFQELDVLVNQFNDMSHRIEEALSSSRKSALRLELLNHDLEAQVRIVKENEEQLTMILEHSYDGILLMNQNGIILRANKALWALFGKIDVDLLGSNNYKDMFDETSILYSSCHLTIESDLNEKVTRTIEHDGKIIEEMVMPIKSDHHQLHGYVMNYRDITKRLELEAQVNHSTKMEAIGRLTSGIAHDFNNILQVIIGYSDLILTSIANGKDVKGLDRKVQSVHDAATKAEVLIRKLMTYSRLDKVVKEAFDVNKCIIEIGQMLDRTIGDDIIMVFDLEEPLPLFYGDRVQLEQIIVNLCVNAKDAMSDQGEIQIRSRLLKGEPDHIRLQVKDNGSGMSEEVMARIFEPFYTTKSVGDGTGLGLSTVFGIIEGHGGTVNVDSEVGVGTTFTIDFPVYIGS